MNTSSSREPFCKNWRLRESPKSLLWEPAVLPVWSNTSENVNISLDVEAEGLVPEAFMSETSHKAEKEEEEVIEEEKA